ILIRMVNVKKGLMVTCDPAMKQLLIHLDETRALGSKFIVKELDDTHIFVDKEIQEVLDNKLDDLMEAMNPENTDK
ncbi:gtf-2H5, partial [Pristionchus pacificus]|uniref:General transcription and DNA repair factor IIH subunit TFB5 n=1 Tax=Pristionchus pacificus TaxID=54126 RepID=A0A8R1V2N3_PRIPA